MPSSSASIFQIGQTSSFTCTSPAGRLSARIIVPAQTSGEAPLLVLHGISRNARELTELFRPEAERTGRMIIVPHFSERDWPVFQRPTRKARPDQALLALLTAFEAAFPDQAGPVSLFGHSGGAQLAHRFAMLFPQRAADLHLAAAGWYCLPNETMAYPYGLADSASPRDLFWARRHGAGLRRFLDRPIHIYVGSRDTARDETLRQTPELDRLQGHTRLARARTYVQALRMAAAAEGCPPRIALRELPGCAHDVAWAIRRAGLARMVTTPAQTGLSSAA
ncbi:alpha/beta fold hydrolase [Celeribacter persicus]|uniref:Pimeloyl-ACP methyl ester carboxylesterase n=1 Tax=Celeribacter persicus TaxID=1651082 RepID=A0A2T5HSP0_9RHOB|nr:alpha/beta hydrolase [Celeribacter persicus]PTQ74605.1 pimeloyl-ACP methyl ester carboxylesterase [Celeribacter persicus]